MVYKSEFHDSQGYTVKHYLKTKWNKTKQTHKQKRIQKTTISDDHKSVEYPKLLQTAVVNENSTAFQKSSLPVSESRMFTIDIKTYVNLYVH